MIKYLSALQKLVPVKIGRYLQIHGWRELCTLFGGTAKQFVSDDDTQVVLIPFDSSYSDYLSLLDRAISDIAEYNKISVLTLLSELLNPSADILKWRIIDNQTELGQIPFDSMISYIDSIKNSLAAALLDTINPKVFHPKLLTSNPQPIGFSGILLAKRQNSFYCTYFLHNRNVADTKSPYPIKRLEVIRWFNQKSMVFNQSLS